MGKNEIYDSVVNILLKSYGARLKTVVLFGSQSRGQAKAKSDHDIFLVIEKLPVDYFQRQKEIRMAIWDIPIRINTISKTPEEVRSNLTPFLLEVCVDGICLYGKDYFEPYRKKALKALNHSGLKRKRIGREWYWQFEKIPKKQWELTWEGFNELS